MRKSAKRFLSTILALTLLCSCMVVMNITAFADDSWVLSEVFSNYVYDSSNKTVTYGDLSYTGNSNNDALVTSVSYPYILFGGAGGATLRRYEIANCYEGDTIKITYTSTSARTLTIFENYSGSNDTATVDQASLSATCSTLGDSVETYTYTVASDGTVLFYFSSNKLGVYSVTRTAASGEIYSITGTVSGLDADDTFTLTSGEDTYTATVSEDETSSTGYIYTASKKAETAPFTADTTFTASKDYYSISPSTVSLTASGNYSFTGTTLAFTLVTVNANVSNTAVTFSNDGRLTSDSTEGVYANSTTSTNNVTVSNGTAKLVDQSASATKLTVDLTDGISSLESGKVTFSGKITDFVSPGSAWDIISFNSSDGVLASLRTPGSSDVSLGDAATSGYIALAVPGEGGYYFASTETGCSSSSIPESVSYEITFDYTNDTVTLVLDGNTYTLDASTTNTGAVSSIVATTAGTASREITLSGIDISVSDVQYVYFGISDEQQGSSESYNILVDGEVKDTGYTVYNGVELLDGTEVTVDSGETLITDGDITAKYIVAYIVSLAEGSSIDSLAISFNEITSGTAEE